MFFSSLIKWYSSVIKGLLSIISSLYHYVSHAKYRKSIFDDMCDFELKEIVEDTDRKGYSDHYVTSRYEKQEKYDYKKINLKENNKK